MLDQRRQHYQSMATKNNPTVSVNCNGLPHRQANTAVLERVKVPSNRRAFFLAVDTDILHDRISDELSFGALSPKDRATFHFLLYLTYCCKGEVLQVTLENTDFCSMSPPIREDFAQGRLFCFVLDMSNEEPCETNMPSSSLDVQSPLSTLAASGDTDGDVSSTQLLSLMNMSVNMDVFRGDDARSDTRDETSPHQATDTDMTEAFEEAFNAFMRLQLVRKRASSINNAMIVMRDSKRELGSMFDWVDIRSDTLNATKVDRKKVKELQGSMYTPACQSGRQVFFLPESIMDLNLNVLETSIGRITDSTSKGESKNLFLAIMSKLTSVQWLKQKVVETGYNSTIPEDMRFVERLKRFTIDLNRSSGSMEVDIRGLLVFRYSVEKLIDRENPDLFVNSLIHRHMAVTKSRIARVLCDVKSRRRTKAIASLLKNGQCHCKTRLTQDRIGACSGECQTAYSCFYNASDHHPFIVSKDDHSYYFAHLYPHLGKLERLSKEMKVRYRGRRQFESIADMVFNILVKHQFSEKESLYQGLTDVIDDRMRISSLSLGHDLTEIHESFYLAPGDADEYPEHSDPLNPLKVYDQALVRYLFCDSLQVGRLFQASTTFNYIITNTAPRYTIERIMLLNVTGPGEGKSYANNVLNYQFRTVKGCIETLTSFTPQSFKYKQKRNSCVVMIDDAHITHEKNMKSVDKESNVIPNTFKNLLDTSVLESDVVTRDMSSGKVDTVKYHAVHNCGFVWNTNTMGFMSDAWADRCLIMESEFPEHVTRTRSTNQIQDTVVKLKMDRIAAVCLYRQNLIQSATMIAESEIMQFGARFDTSRDACLAALYASHIVCTGVISRRVSFCINQLVFAEAMKLACHFVFDIWIPPWTEIPDVKDYPHLGGYMKQMNGNRLKALNQLSFGQICLETNAVYKLCTSACLPDICPRAVDIQGHFACKVLGYILTQIHEQQLKTSLKNGHMSISGIDAMFFSDKEIKGGNEVANGMLLLCSTCKVPARQGTNPAITTYKLCTYRYATNHNAPHIRRGASNHCKKVGSVTVPLEAVYDILALYAPRSHSGFWDQLGEAMVEAYEKGEFEDVNAFGQFANDSSENQPPMPRLIFTLDFNKDPLRSVILEATAAIEPLNELTFNKCVLGGETFQCSAPLYYGGVVRKAMSPNAPKEAYDKRHLKESRLGPKGTFHGPRLNVYSAEYSGVPVKNVSSFCNTRTVYHQEKIILRVNRDNRGYLAELEEDWEWKDATDVFNKVHGTDVFSVEMLKRDYAATMVDVKGEMISARPLHSRKLKAMITGLLEANGRSALALRKGKRPASDTQQCRTQKRRLEQVPRTSSQGHKRTNNEDQPRGSVERLRVDKRKRPRFEG